jgi:pilus assembly protein TadC
MTREARRRQITALVEPRLTADEELLGTSVVWAARVGRTPLVFTGRHRYLLALTGRRLYVFERRRRRNREAEPVLAKSIDNLVIERTRALPMFQVLLRVSDERRLVLEFRRRDRATGRALARLVSATPQP